MSSFEARHRLLRYAVRGRQGGHADVPVQSHLTRRQPLARFQPTASFLRPPLCRLQQTPVLRPAPPRLPLGADTHHIVIKAMCI